MVDTFPGNDPGKKDADEPSHTPPAQAEKLRHTLRKSLLQKRDALPPGTSRQAGNGLLHQLQKWFETRKPAKTTLNIAGYLAVGGEMDPAAAMSWLRANGHLTWLPIIRPEQQGRLLFARFTDSTQLVAGTYNIPEPVFDTNDLLDARGLDIVLVPLVGFDHQGNRLGMGGGFYDRTFSYRMDDSTAENILEAQAMLGVAHDFQHLDHVPAESWDVPLDAVITDKAIYTPD